MTPTRPFGYNPNLDGMRGIAIIAVLVYHSGIFFSKHPLTGGFLGVDIFFVLSGFLITSVLLREFAKTGTISLKAFYLRRIYRLIPAYWIFLLTLFLVGWLVLPQPQDSILYADNRFAFAGLYLTNWLSAYGQPGGHLNHTWSLSIEEQFYILWSSILGIGIWRQWKPKSLTMIVAGLVAAIVLMRIVRVYTGTSANVLYYSTETRIDSILIGCFASMLYMWRFIPDRMLQSTAFSIAAAGSAAFQVWALIYVDKESLDTYVAYLPLFSAASAVTVLWAISHSLAALRFKPLAWLGVISYSLYLWHYFAFELMRSAFFDLSTQVASGFVLAFILACASYYLVEKPFLKQKDALSTKPEASQIQAVEHFGM